MHTTADNPAYSRSILNRRSRLGYGLGLKKNFLWTILGNVVYAACQWAMITVLAKLGTPEVVGRFSLGFAVTAPVITFCSLKLRAVQATDAAEDYRFGDYLALRLIAMGVAVSVITVVAFAQHYGIETGLIILTVGIAKAFESVSDMYYGLLQQHERMDRIAISMVIKGLLSLAVMAIIMLVTGNVLAATASLAVTWALILFIYDIPNGRRLLAQAGQRERLSFQKALRCRKSKLISLFWLTLPLGVVITLNSLYVNLPRYFVRAYCGEKDLGIWCALYYIVVAGNTVVAALGQSAGPRLSKYYAADNKKAFIKLLGQLVGAGTLLGILGWLVVAVCGKQLLTLVYRPDYAARTNVMVLLMITAGIGYTYVFIGSAVNAMRKFSIQLPIHILSFFVTLGLSWFLIRRFGLIGASWAMMGDNIFEFTMYSLVIATVLRKWNPIPCREIEL